jgi:lipopolysaccharide transport system ATP-binding protein
MTVLHVSNIGKAFRSYSSEWLRILGWLGFHFKPISETWVVRNIDFRVEAGEALGVIGVNGAGKSTLLKIVTGTLQPTQGSVQLSGSVSAILELGMGFNPELTARQNVYHSAGLMGFSSSEIEASIPEVESFAEIGR